MVQGCSHAISLLCACRRAGILAQGIGAAGCCGAILTFNKGALVRQAMDMAGLIKKGRCSWGVPADDVVGLEDLARRDEGKGEVITRQWLDMGESPPCPLPRACTLACAPAHSPSHSHAKRKPASDPGRSPPRGTCLVLFPPSPCACPVYPCPQPLVAWSLAATGPPTATQTPPPPHACVGACRMAIHCAFAAAHTMTTHRPFVVGGPGPRWVCFVDDSVDNINDVRKRCPSVGRLEVRWSARCRWSASACARAATPWLACRPSVVASVC